MYLYSFSDLNKDASSDWFKDKIGLPPNEDMIYLSKLGSNKIFYTNYIQNYTEFYLVERNRVRLVIQTKRKGSAYTIGAVRGDKNKTPAHKVYAHLIRDHNIVLVSDRKQTIGGQNIWIKLSREKNIGIHGWDIKKSKPVNIGVSLSKVIEEVYISESDLVNKSLLNIKNVVLVAHKR